MDTSMALDQLNPTDLQSVMAFLVGAGIGIIMLLVVIGILSIVALWILFNKAHEHGWAAIVPFYNSFVLFKISWGNGWLFLIPTVINIISYATGNDGAMGIVNTILGIFLLVFCIMTLYKFAQAYGQGVGFTIGLIFLDTIFLCIMAFSSKIQFVGTPVKGAAAAAPAAAPAASAAPAAQGDKFCQNCGTKLEPGVDVCPSCGAKQ